MMMIRAKMKIPKLVKNQIYLPRVVALMMMLRKQLGKATRVVRMKGIQLQRVVICLPRTP